MRSHNDNVPESVGLTWKEGKNETNTGWGVATSGTMIFNGISGEGVDPFYPAVYGKVKNAYEAVEKID